MISNKSGWKELKLRYLIEINPSKKEIQHLSNETKVSFIPMESVSETGTIDLSQSRLLEQVESGYTYFRNGDILLARITPCFENGKLALASNLTNKIGFGSTEFHVLRARERVINKFIYYIIRSHPFKKIGAAMMTGAAGQKRVPESYILEYRQLIPSIEEQQEITIFLDKETSKIDNLIEKKQHLIELLQEKRQALITNAVTKGLDPNVSMKDSGIPWLGEVPEHWELKKIKHLSPFISRGVSPVYIEDSEYPIVNQSCIRWDGVNLENVKFSFNNKPEKLKGYLHHLDVLVNSTGTGTLGRVAVIEKPKNMIADSHVTIIRTSKKLLNPYFLKYLLSTQTYQGFIYSYAVTGATNQIELSREKLREVPLYIPALEEQDQIVSTVFRQEQTINKVTSKIQTQITKLKEYRQALITAAVIGKIDVREKVSS